MQSFPIFFNSDSESGHILIDGTSDRSKIWKTVWDGNPSHVETAGLYWLHVTPNDALAVYCNLCQFSIPSEKMLSLHHIITALSTQVSSFSTKHNHVLCPKMFWSKFDVQVCVGDLLVCLIGCLLYRHLAVLQLITYAPWYIHATHLP